MGKNIFRIFNPGGEKEDPKEKRRAQLRRAQQTYRDRKNTYTRNLESELGRTRANEAILMRQCEGLKATVERLEALLCQYGIDVPDGLETTEPYHETGCTPKETSSDFVTSRDNPLVVNKTAEDASAVSWMTPESSTDLHSESWPLPTQQHRQQSIATQPNKTSPGGPVRLGDLDQVTLGMEFVLTLEEPCLGHIHGDPAKPQEPHGHGLTTTSQLLYVCGPSPPLSPGPAISPSYQSAPEAMLERLLSLAPELTFDGEVTPIQAWNSIRCRPHFGGLDARSLRVLAEKLRAAVKCHGFGAVIQQATLEGLVYETLVVGRNF